MRFRRTRGSRAASREVSHRVFGRAGWKKLPLAEKSGSREAFPRRDRRDLPCRAVGSARDFHRGFPQDVGRFGVETRVFHRVWENSLENVEEEAGKVLKNCVSRACFPRHARTSVAALPLVIFCRSFCPARLRLRILDLADPLFFSPARLADKRTLRPGPLVNHPAPEDEEGGPSPPLDSTLLRGVRTSAFLHLCSMGLGPTADGTSSISPIVC